MSSKMFLQCFVLPVSIYPPMTSRQQRLKESHIYTDEQNCSYNTQHLENQDPSCSVGVLTQPSRLNTSYNSYPTNTQCFPLYDGETSSSQNHHDQYPSHSTSQLFVEDLGANKSSSITHGLISFANDQQTIGQGSYQRKRKSLFYNFLIAFYLCI